MNLFCRYHKFQMHRVLDDGLEPSEKSIRHMKACSRCQSWYQGQRRLITHLKQLAKSQEPFGSPQLLPGIMASMRNQSSEEPVSAPATTPLPWQKWLMPLATSCVVVTAMVQLFPANELQPNAVTNARWLSLSPDSLIQHTTGLSIADWGQQLDEPLEKEWILLKEDAQAAAGGLAGTFLPSKLVAFYQPSMNSKP
jgi:hypothetical protein